jgi:DNA replication protein DnaC
MQAHDERQGADVDMDSVQPIDEAWDDIVDRALSHTSVDTLDEVDPVAREQRGRSVPCGSCNGLGKTRDGTYCSCDYGRRKQKENTRRMRDALGHSGLPDRLRPLTLATWDERCGDEADKSTARRLVGEVIEDGCATGPQGTPRPGVLLHGKNGIGKTGLLAGLLKRLYDQGHAVLWIKWSGMIDSVQATYSGGSEGQSTHGRIATLQNAPHLFLDDFGEPFRSRDRWRVSDDRRSITWRVVSARHEHDRPTYITTNHDGLGPISDQFSPRIADRLMEMCTVVQMSGRNLRHPSNQ